jgi:uncharacterized protein (TIGR02145 family)
MRKQLPKFALIATFGLVMAFPFSCALEDPNGDSSSSGGGVGTGPSSPGGNPDGGGGGGSSSSVYQPGWDYEAYIAKWITYNLTYEEPPRSICYSNSNANCVAYGRLYDWAAAMNLPEECNSLPLSDALCTITPPHRGICPEGKHIPSKAEWEMLVTSAGGVLAGKKLKATTDWLLAKGTDDYGFNALPSGYKVSGTFGGAGTGSTRLARWWSITEDNATYVHTMSISDQNSTTNLTPGNKSDFFSVRCLDD